MEGRITAKVRDLDAMLSAVEAVNKYAVLHFRENGVYVGQMDQGKNVFMKMFVSKSFFQSYSSPGITAVTDVVTLKELVKALKQQFVEIVIHDDVIHIADQTVKADEYVEDYVDLEVKDVFTVVGLDASPTELKKFIATLDDFFVEKIDMSIDKKITKITGRLDGRYVFEATYENNSHDGREQASASYSVRLLTLPLGAISKVANIIRLYTFKVGVGEKGLLMLYLEDRYVNEYIKLVYYITPRID
ncbi:MAG: hypothetical protein ACK4SY_07805 [Pyrobaculum sp.]